MLTVKASSNVPAIADLNPASGNGSGWVAASGSLTEYLEVLTF